MAGMLNEAQNPQRPAEAPMEPAAEEEKLEISDDSADVFDSAVQIAYSEQMFPRVIQMFEEGGPEGFPQAMAVTLLGVMQKVEADAGGKLDDQVLAEVGAKLFEQLSEDIIGNGVVEGVTPEILSQAVQESIKTWGEANPDRFDPQVFEQAAMEALEESGDMPPVTPNPEPQNMVPDETAMPPQGGMLSGGM